MKIAIHHRIGSFSDAWIEYCRDNHIPYKVVDAYKDDIIDQLADCDIFMWHHHHAIYKDTLFAKQLLCTLQIAGKKVFPDVNTGFTFDDKVAQKYLLEAVNVPLVPSYVFYSRSEALEWIRKESFPKIFKLRGGAGASNVRLVKSKRQAVRIVNLAFSRGISTFNRMDHLKDAWRLFREHHLSWNSFCKEFVRSVISTDYAQKHGREKGYVYFQNFIPNNKSDVRLIVIKDRAYGMKRMCRKNDFRASGSSNFIYDNIDERTLKIAFNTAEKLALQSVAFDFIYDELGNPLIIEMSYGYGTKGSSKCKGYWTKDLKWHEGTFNPFGWQIENLING